MEHLIHEGPKPLTDPSVGLCPLLVLGELFENLHALMLEDLKLLMISLFGSHHCLDSSLVVCEEHVLAPSPLPYLQVATHSKKHVKTVNFGFLEHVVGDDSVITGAGQVMESGGAPSSAVVTCSVIVAVLLPSSY